MSAGRTTSPGPTGPPERTTRPLQAELRMVLTAAIDDLPVDYRTAVILRDVEGLSNLEIGEVLGIGVPNVKSRVHRARLFLRKRLGQYLAERVPAACGT